MYTYKAEILDVNYSLYHGVLDDLENCLVWVVMKDKLLSMIMKIHDLPLIMIDMNINCKALCLVIST